MSKRFRSSTGRTSTVRTMLAPRCATITATSAPPSCKTRAPPNTGHTRGTGIRHVGIPTRTCSCPPNPVVPVHASILLEITFCASFFYNLILTVVHCDLCCGGVTGLLIMTGPTRWTAIGRVFYMVLSPWWYVFIPPPLPLSLPPSLNVRFCAQTRVHTIACASVRRCMRALRDF